MSAKNATTKVSIPYPAMIHFHMQRFKIIGFMVRFFKKEDAENMDKMWKSIFHVHLASQHNNFLYTYYFSHILHLDIIKSEINIHVGTNHLHQSSVVFQRVFCRKQVFTARLLLQLFVLLLVGVWELHWVELPTFITFTIPITGLELRRQVPWGTCQKQAEASQWLTTDLVVQHVHELQATNATLYCY